jgi:protein O-mannosyl-transferase
LGGCGALRGCVYTPAVKDPASASDSPQSINLRVIAMGLLIFCTTLVAYVPSLKGGFIWDDDTFLTQNKLIKAADGLYRFWLTREPTDYWPMTSSSLWIEWRLWGMNATGYHATNVILHAAEALLLWRILDRLCIPGAYLAAFIFAVHPMNVESVAWITQRKNLMAMLFSLMTVLFFLRTKLAGARRTGSSPPMPERGGALWYWLSLIAFTLGMLSKGSVAMLPVVLLGVLAWRRRLSLRDLAAASPFFLIGAVFTVVDILFQHHGSAEIVRNAGMLERLAGAGAIVWFYLYKILLPLDLMFVYPQWHIRAGDPRWWIAPFAVVAVTAFLWRNRGGRLRPLLFAWGYFCVMLIPVMGFTDVYFMKYSLVADHFAHLAMIGVIAVVAAAWEYWQEQVAPDPPLRVVRSPSAPRRIVPVVGAWAPRIAAAAVVGFLALQTWRQGAIYRDPLTLYQATLAKNPSCWLFHNNIGVIYEHGGDSAKAIAEYEEALRFNAEYAGAQNNLGSILSRTPGRMNEAVAHLQEALRIQPDFAAAHNNLGIVWYSSGRPKEAIAEYQETLRYNPDFADAHNNLANALRKIDRMDEAIMEYREAIRLMPNDAEFHFNLAGALLRIPGRENEAAAELETFLRIKPDNEIARRILEQIRAAQR